jgi:hypothetical protein
LENTSSNLVSYRMSSNVIKSTYSNFLPKGVTRSSLLSLNKAKMLLPLKSISSILITSNKNII